MNDLRKALFRALEKSDINMLRAVLAQGVSLAYEEGDPEPVFFALAIYRSTDIESLQLLLSAGADITVREFEYQDSLLHWYVNEESDAILPWLIAQGLDVNAQNVKGRTPLTFAVYGLHPENSSAQMERARRDVGRLLDAGADINLGDADGTTSLHTAAYWGAPEVVDFLLSRGAHANAARRNGETPLHLIAAMPGDSVTPGHAAVIDQLLAAGADINRVDEDGYTVLSCTPLHGNHEVARKLLACGADIAAAGARALRDAVSGEDDELLDLFIAAGSAVDTQYADEQLTPLILAAHEGYFYGIKTLLDHGANIEAITVDGETPLLNAVRKQRYDCVALLLERGANRHHTDLYSNTALSWATRLQDARLIELLTS